MLVKVAPLLGKIAFDIAGHVAYAYSLAVLFVPSFFVVLQRLRHTGVVRDDSRDHMDTLDLEEEKGITILAKAASIPIRLL